MTCALGSQANKNMCGPKMGKIVLLCWVALLTLVASGCSNFMGRISGETARQEALKAEQLHLERRCRC
jgi:hypothetical protein